MVAILSACRSLHTALFHTLGECNNMRRSRWRRRIDHPDLDRIGGAGHPCGRRREQRHRQNAQCLHAILPSSAAVRAAFCGHTSGSGMARQPGRRRRDNDNVVPARDCGNRRRRLG